MASTYTAYYGAVTAGATKDMADVFNATGSGQVVSVYHIRSWIGVITVVTGAMTDMYITRHTAASGGTTVTPETHDTANTALNANVTAGYNRTVTPGSIFRRWYNHSEELSGVNVLRILWPVNVIFDSLFNASVQPLVARENEGIMYYSVDAGATAVSTAITFTI